MLGTVAVHVLEQRRADALAARSPGRLRGIVAAVEALRAVALDEGRRRELEGIRTAALANLRYVERGIALDAFAEATGGPDAGDPDVELVSRAAAATLEGLPLPEGLELLLPGRLTRLSERLTSPLKARVTELPSSATALAHEQGTAVPPVTLADLERGRRAAFEAASFDGLVEVIVGAYELERRLPAATRVLQEVRDAARQDVRHLERLLPPHARTHGEAPDA